MCSGLHTVEWRYAGFATTIIGGSVSERPKVQHSKCCVVNSHRGFKSRRYRRWARSSNKLRAFLETMRRLFYRVFNA